MAFTDVSQLDFVDLENYIKAVSRDRYAYAL